MAIRSFRDAETESVFHGRFTKRFGNDVARAAHRRLLMLHAAKELLDLRIPPSNRLEALKGDRKGQHSIRVNNQWRVCFRWNDGDAADVELTDYH
jgi:toxin HigB-1